MKTKVLGRRRKEGEQLAIRTTKGEKLDYAQAELLRSEGIEGLLPFEYEEQRDGSTLFLYGLADTIPLEMYLRAEMTPALFAAMLDDVIGCFERCGAGGLDPTRLLFDHRFSRLGAADNRLCFAYVPAQGLPSSRETAMGLLSHIAERASFVCEDSKADAAKLLDYLKRQTVFSAVDFKEFLKTTGFWLPGPEADARAGGGGRAGKSAGEAPSPPGRGPFDFVKAQAGIASSQEARASLSLAERIASDVAGRPVPCEAGAEAPAIPPGRPQRASEGSTAQTAPAKPPASGAPPTTALKGGGVSPAALPGRACACPVLVRASDGARFALDPLRKTTLGRSRDCTVQTAGNTNVSRHHATITFDGEGCLITDEGSLNRTYVNGEALDAHASRPLGHGDAVRLADEEFRVE